MKRLGGREGSQKSLSRREPPYLGFIQLKMNTKYDTGHKPLFNHNWYAATALIVLVSTVNVNLTEKLIFPYFRLFNTTTMARARINTLFLGDSLKISLYLQYPPGLLRVAVYSQDISVRCHGVKGDD